MHRRVAVNEVCFPAMPVAAEIAWWQAVGVNRVGLLNLRRPDGDWRTATTAVQRAGIEIAYLTHARMFDLDDPASWPQSTQALFESVDVAVEAGAPVIYTTTGPRGTLTFEEAVEALEEAYAPVRAYAADREVTMLVETANQLFAHTHFLHSLADTTAVARRVGMGVCLDMHAVWTDSSLSSHLDDAAPLLGLVQVGDFVPGMFSLSRDVPGDGILPIESIVRATLEAGYMGLFDLELFRRPVETALDDTGRGVRWVSDLLDRLGA